MPGQTGPKTPEGKARSSKNAIKHGLTCTRMFVLSNEDRPVWDALLQTWIAKLQPQDDAELCIVTDIAHAEWRIRRARTWECGLLDWEMDLSEEAMDALFDGEPVDEGYRQSEAFKALAKTPVLVQLHRYETRARRAFKNGLAALKELRKLTPDATPASANPAPAPAGGGKPEPIHVPKPQPRTQQHKLRPAAPCKKRQNEMPRHRRRHKRHVKITLGRRSNQR